MKLNHNHTVKACFVGYTVQAAVNNFAPLLFVTFQSEFGIPLSKITALITVNFLLQLIIDFASTFFIDKIGYRVSVVAAHFFAAMGFVSLAIFPGLLPDPFCGLLISIFLCAIGGGLLEVVVSPLAEACPTDHKESTMSMLHSFYCWGTVGVIAVSTLFFNLIGIDNWKIVALLWAVLPVFNGLFFLKVPIVDPTESGEEVLSLKELLKNKMFWIFVVIMCCAGASEQAVSQWSSVFTEKSLGISKSFGDLLGPTLFSLMMGFSRFIYGKFGKKISLSRMMLFSTGLCVASYLLIALSDFVIAGLVGMALAGFSVGIMWPGSFSRAVASVKGGTAMFALLALAGDLGCALGPTVAGKTATLAGENLKFGIMIAVIFPILMLIMLKFADKNEKFSKK